VRWVLLDVLIVLLALGFLALVLLRLWRRVKALFGTVSEAGAALGTAGDALGAAQAAAPSRAGLPAYPVGTSNEERA
jgi:hypothetical protein